MLWYVKSALAVKYCPLQRAFTAEIVSEDPGIKSSNLFICGHYCFAQWPGRQMWLLMKMFQTGLEKKIQMVPLWLGEYADGMFPLSS